MDTVYQVCYDGSHQTATLMITTDEALAISEAKKQPYLRVAKWEDGKLDDMYYYENK
jgi:hypothetical protein